MKYIGTTTKNKMPYWEKETKWYQVLDEDGKVVEYSGPHNQDRKI